MPAGNKAAPEVKELTEEQVKHAKQLAELALSNPSLFESNCTILEPVSPELVAHAKEIAAEQAVSRMKAAVAVQMIPKDDRPEDSGDFMEMLDEFLLCANRAHQIGRIIFPTRVVASQGQGGGQKKMRRVSFEVGGETFELKASKKIAGKKEGTVIVESSETE